MATWTTDRGDSRAQKVFEARYTVTTGWHEALLRKKQARWLREYRTNSGITSISPVERFGLIQMIDALIASSDRSLFGAQLAQAVSPSIRNHVVTIPEKLRMLRILARVLSATEEASRDLSQTVHSSSQPSLV